MLVFNIKNNKKEVNRSIITFPVFSKDKKFKYDFVQINQDKKETIKKVDDIKIDEKFLEEFLQNQLSYSSKPILFHSPINEDHKIINDYIVKNFCKKKQEGINNKKIKQFFDLIPDINLPYVEWRIEKQFNNSKLQYINKHKKFIQYFTLEMKRLCDGGISVDIDKPKNSNKKRKEAMLYSSQLLGLIGKGGTAYLNESLVELYKDDMKKREEFLLSYRLMTKKGKFVKLTTIENKQKRKNAEILNLANCLAQMAEEKGFTYSMPTLTLPGAYHPAPTNGKDTFNGVMPLEAQTLLHGFWQSIRSAMSNKGWKAGIDYFGCSVFEIHRDSCLHMHCLIYTSKKNQAELEKIVNRVARNHYKKTGEYVKFDFKKSDGRADGATYIYKYLMKSNGVYTNDTHLKTTAGRYFYSARGFNFFGLSECLTKWRYLLDNYKSYDKFFCDDLRKTFETYNFYNFQKKYQKFFDLIRDDKKVVQFVDFDLRGNEDEDFRLRNSTFNQRVIIKKKIFCIFEITKPMKKIKDENIDDIKNLDLENITYRRVKNAYNSVIKKDIDYEKNIEDHKMTFPESQYIIKHTHIDIDNIINFYTGNSLVERKEEVISTVKQSDSK